MGLYWGTVGMSFMMLIGLLACFVWSFKRKDENGHAKKLTMEEGLLLTPLTLLAGGVLVFHLLDLPNVLLKNTEHYKGHCEIDIFDDEKMNSSVEIGSRSIMYDVNGYKEGNYYCEIEYYPVTEIGKSLNVYTFKGGELIESK